MSKNLNNKFFEIDSRRKKDIINKIKELSQSYVPEWFFDDSDNDAGAAIANIYADMLEDDINKLNMLMYKYRVELMNMVGITLKPSSPAKSVVLFNLLPTVSEGTYVPKKTKLIADGVDGNKIIFETNNSVYVTNSTISNIYSTSKIAGKIINIFDSENIENQKNKTFYMFNFSSDGEQKNEIIIGHPYALNLNKNSMLEIYFGLNKNNSSDILKGLIDKNEYEWKYLTEDGFELFNNVEVQGEKIVLGKLQNSQKVKYDNISQYYISIKKKNNIINNSIAINSLKISSYCKNLLPEVIYQEDSQVDINEFYPFGNKLSLYNECYIAADDILTKKNANIKIEFDVNYVKNMVEIDYINDVDYKIIMKKPSNNNYSIVECEVENFVFEYFNGIGWAKLNFCDEYKNIFSKRKTGKIKLEFICPNDINPISVNAYTKNWLRIRLLKADNCYRMPCCHLVPVIKNIKFFYNYVNGGVEPEFVKRYSGITSDDISELIVKNEYVDIFKPVEFEKNSIFIGFDKQFYDGPISIYFHINGVNRKNADDITIEYSCIGSGEIFKPLKIIDNTENFRHSGTIIFIPPLDMAEHYIFNKQRFWLKLTDQKNKYTNIKNIKISDIILNACQVKNINSQPEEIFYVDKSQADITLQLSYNNILYSDVFVNEVTILSIKEMENMLKTTPNDVLVEYDDLGNYLSFFVKWVEVNSFIKSKPSDRHYVLDKNKGLISFGNAKNGKIPPKQIRPAVKVFTVTCDGSRGNIDVGQINKTDVMINFINGVYNPIPAYTGNDMESIDSALKRGANILSSYNRLVSENDFENAILNYSDVIDKVKCVASINEYGLEDEGSITIAILMKEFQKSSEVFSTMKNQIKNNLTNKCELSLNKEKLHLIDPVFVKLCVSVWVEVDDANSAFEIKSDIIKNLNEFIDPVRGNFNNHGWEIGKLPKEVQIYSFLKSKNINATIKKVVLTGKVQNVNGTMEREINDILNNPFVIGINGQHDIFMEFK